MHDFIKDFVEDNIDLIESNDWEKLFERWYEDYNDEPDAEYDDFQEFKSLLEELNVDTTNEFRIAQDKVMTDKLREAIDSRITPMYSATKDWTLEFSRIIDLLWCTAGIPYVGLCKLLEQLAPEYDFKVIHNGTAFRVPGYLD